MSSHFLGKMHQNLHKFCKIFQSFKIETNIIFRQYRGFETIKIIKSLEKVKAPIRPILVMTKLRTILPSLKAPKDKNIASNVVYKLTCSGCMSTYIGLPPDFSLVGRRST